MTTTLRRASRAVPLGLTVLAASSLSGCGGDPDVAAVCVDPETQERADDSLCDDSDEPEDYDGNNGSIGTGFFWYYLGTQSARSIPAIGSPVSGGTFNGSGLVSSGRSVQRGGLPADGASSFKSYSKSGGFGSSKGVSSS
ncbi:hypothetical protein ASG49_02560 [Marmoricola sp. Leaf446]|uniref:hypothetical protein n=1 Tax=Marmoricola sp. Leaf446 TaxID=1736379 RepID=UPI000700219E|nr:hypothetical protein [Marmoricola sp. Leaf446]KQT93864.1 hypothetical protein ASG49_02560 [Marmoricola sp. Leaf446]